MARQARGRSANVTGPFGFQADARDNRGFLRSPAPDSNRRPLPYHGGLGALALLGKPAVIGVWDASNDAGGQ
jgi:hypothetical protein